MYGGLAGLVYVRRMASGRLAAETAHPGNQVVSSRNGSTGATRRPMSEACQPFLPRYDIDQKVKLI